MKVDVTKADEVEKMVAGIMEKLSKIDVLINNVGFIFRVSLFGHHRRGLE